MTTSFKLTTKFYQKENNFKNFKDLSEEQLSTISKKVYKAQEIMQLNLPNSYKKISNFEIYQNTIQYLINPKIYFDLKTFDERLTKIKIDLAFIVFFSLYRIFGHLQRLLAKIRCIGRGCMI